MQRYNLGFISDKDIYKHVRATVMQYRRSINIKEFNKNIIDPIKLTFDSKIYNQTIEETIKSECIRQIDKTNNNRIGYFHQFLSKYAGNNWEVPANGKKGGFDVVNDELHIYAEMKNKHNTMNSSSAAKTYMKMQNKLLRDDKATCILVEVISRQSQDITWQVTVDKEKFNNSRIRRMSIDKFYELVFGDSKAFFKLCIALPKILDDILKAEPSIATKYDVYDKLDKKDFLKSLYLLAFKTYEGFDNLK
ncbi:Eco47II family restriction endonuclease [Prevotella histicola]|jgi:eco47II restriction endonuclease|uniref:Eco47II family restriction endonuclease n=1 Tax=Prevotella histicola TaxID=470565 RepID=UPI001C5CC417|nr:Eco47II family restriction endonuclease [Prevotella histicola]MBW4758074.1 Eco47II family restriction endonuclease [Prevotella histicola]